MGIFNIFNKKNKQPQEPEQPIKSLPLIKSSFWSQFNKAILGKTTIDATVLDNIEEMLLSADVGIPTTIKIIEQLEKQVAQHKCVSIHELKDKLCVEIINLLTLPIPSSSATYHKPYVLLIVGVNGVGKTTTIAKLATRYKAQGKSIILGAGDTFRAAASQQLQYWSEQVDVELVTLPHNADPSAVAYETVQRAIINQIDIAIIDTAGRLHNKTNLMQELSKINRTISKKIPDAPHEVLLVLDATTGQNGFAQIKAFNQAIAITGIIVTKLDGTAKGGSIIGIVDQFQLPVQYIGVGEKLNELQPFDKKSFVEGLFKQPES